MDLNLNSNKIVNSPLKASSVVLRPDYLPPCEEAVKLYKLQRQLRKLHETYQKGNIISLNKNQVGLKKIFKSNGGKTNQDLDVYNITKPFQIGDKTLMAGRLQTPGMNPDSKIVFFLYQNNDWTPQGYAFGLEDPFFTKINGELIFGGVEVSKTRKELRYRTVFYKGKTPADLKLFLRGPYCFKDIRLVQLADKSIGLFTRPRGKIGGFGQIGFTILKSLDQLSPEVITNAPLIAQHFPEDEWGGVNEAYAIKDGKILVLGHRAYFDKEINKHYYPWLFIHDPKTGKSQDLGIIGSSDDFPKTLSRDEDLDDVLFSGGIDWKTNTLYVGIRDMTAGSLKIPSLEEIIAFRNSNAHPKELNTPKIITS